MKRTASLVNLVAMIAAVSGVSARAPALPPEPPPMPKRETRSAKYRRMTEELFIETRDDPRFTELTNEQIRTEIASMLEREGFTG